MNEWFPGQASEGEADEQGGLPADVDSETQHFAGRRTEASRSLQFNRLKKVTGNTDSFMGEGFPRC